MSSEAFGFDFRDGVDLEEVRIASTPVAAESVVPASELLGSRVIEAVKTISENDYREELLSREGKDYLVVGHGPQFPARQLVVLGIEDERWTPLNSETQYAGLVAVSATWAGIMRLPAYNNSDIIKNVRDYADKLRVEIQS